MSKNRFQFIDVLIDPIPVFGPILADLFYTFSGLRDAMNLRKLADVEQPLPPPGDNIMHLVTRANAVDGTIDVRKAA